MLSKRHFRVDDLYLIVLDSLTRCGLTQGGSSYSGTLFWLRVLSSLHDLKKEHLTVRK